MWLDRSQGVYGKENSTGEYWCQDFFHCMSQQDGRFYYDMQQETYIKYTREGQFSCYDFDYCEQM
jgi:hypothetical protein